MIVLVSKIEQADDMGMVKLLQVPGWPFKAHDKQLILQACGHAGP